MTVMLPMGCPLANRTALSITQSVFNCRLFCKSLGMKRMLRHLKKALYPTVSKYFIKTTLMEGLLKDYDQPFRYLFAYNSLYDNSLYNEYLSSKIYAAPPKVISGRKIWTSTLKKMVENSRQDWDICIAVLPSQYEPQFRGLYAFKSQKHVRQIIDTSGPWEEIKGRFHKTIKRFSNNMAKCAFGHHISTDIKEFDFFYHRMYKPHTERQFGKFSVVDSYENLRWYFLKGFLLFVTNGGQPVAAALCQIKDRTLIYRRAGVLDGDDRYTKNGAQMAFYYYMLRLAKKNDLLQLDLKSSSTFFYDGVYRHKRGWGAAVYPKKTDTWVYFFIPNHSEKVVRFFERNPMIIHSEQGLKGVVGLSGGTELSFEGKKKLFANFYAPGLEGLILFTSYSKRALEVAWRDLREPPALLKQAAAGRD